MKAKCRPFPGALICTTMILGLVTLCSPDALTEGPAEPPANPASNQSAAVADTEKRYRTVNVLEEELKRIDDLIREKVASGSDERVKAGVSSTAMGNEKTSNVEQLRKLEAGRLEMKASFARMEAFYRSLTNLSRAKQREAIASAGIDPQLTVLLQELHSYEKKLAATLQTNSRELLEAKISRQLVDELNRQVDDRVDGTLKMLAAKAAGEKARMETILMEVEDFKARELDQAKRRRLGPKANLELLNLETVREWLRFRISQEKKETAAGARR